MGKKVAVLGAGIIGLSTAVNIQEQIPGSKVKVIAENFDTDVTSYGSGGLFVARVTSNNPIEDARRWRDASWDHFRQLATGPEAGKSGAILSNGYILSRHEDPMPVLKPYVYTYRKMPEQELKLLNFPSELKHGYHLTTVISDQSKYLKWLMKRFKSNGGVIQRKKIVSLEEFVGQYDVVVNCTGLGSRELVGDPEVFSMRGQVVRVKAPWVRNFLLNPDNETQIIPGDEFVSLGSVKQRDNESLEPDLGDTADILKKCTWLAPSLKCAEIDHTWVGLRPCRDKIRLEKEDIHFKTGRLKVVHNYGHGTSGIALSWGTALDATRMVRTCLTGTGSKL